MIKGLLIGGDARQKFAARYLSEQGVDVLTLDVPDMEDNFKRSDIDAMNFVILPIPSQKRQYGFLSEINKNCIVFGNQYPEGNLFQSRHFLSLTKREDFQILNAVPTAESAVAILIDNLPKILRECRIAVVGYGRIGKVLVEMLAKTYAKVTMATRRYEDIIMAKTVSNDTIQIGNGDLGRKFIDEIRKYDAIVNTAPVPLFREEILHIMDQRTILVDLSSGCVGVDFACAERLKMNAIKAPGLPGKMAPQTAGEIIGQVVYHILQEEQIL